MRDRSGGALPSTERRRGTRDRYNHAVLNCQHHIQWVREVAGGLHQCILCQQVVTRKDVYPKLEDLPDDFRKRWDAHEATRPVPPPAAEPKA